MGEPSSRDLRAARRASQSSRRPVTVTWYSFSIRWLGWASRWAKAPSLVSSSRPSESMSSLPTGYTRPPQPDTSAATVGRPFSSDRVVTTPRGLWSIR